MWFRVKNKYALDPTENVIMMFQRFIDYTQYKQHGHGDCSLDASLAQIIECRRLWICTFKPFLKIELDRISSLYKISTTESSMLQYLPIFWINDPKFCLPLVVLAVPPPFSHTLARCTAQQDMIVVKYSSVLQKGLLRIWRTYWHVPFGQREGVGDMVVQTICCRFPNLHTLLYFSVP